MLLTRLDCCLVSAIVIMAAMFGQTNAQNYSDTTIIDLTSAASRYSRMIVVPRGPVLRFLVPEAASLDDTVQLNHCPGDGYKCRDVTTQNMAANSFEFRYTLNLPQQESINITIDSSYKVGCRNYMHPQSAMAGGDTRVNLTCEPVPVDLASFEGNVTIEWRRFFLLEELQNFIQNCSGSPEECSNQFRDEGHLLPKQSFPQMDCSLTINNPSNNQAWFVASFTVDGDRTYLAPYTFLYRWPTISTHYEFSLEVFEPATDYDRLQCVAESFPPIKAFAWTRDDTPINSSFPRYIFTNVTNGNQTSATITITEVMFEDSALFTCNVANLGDLLKTDVSLSVRLRVKHRLRPLWPALGIIGVGILVALFIIIGHFWDKAIEKYQNEPSNPSHHKRLQSVTSTADETSNNVPSGKKSQATNQVNYTVSDHHHLPVKRLSSARIQLLEEPQ